MGPLFENVRCFGSVANLALIQKSKMCAIHIEIGLQIKAKLYFQSFTIFWLLNNRVDNTEFKLQ